jgi:hypothetical protein
MEANCKNCKTRTNFVSLGKKKYRCSSCDAELHNCASNNCSEMISFGFYCNKCIGNAFKKGGSLVVVGVLAIGTAAIKSIRRLP